MRKIPSKIISILLSITMISLLYGCSTETTLNNSSEQVTEESEQVISEEDVELINENEKDEFTGSLANTQYAIDTYTEVNNGQPSFTKDEITTESYESYSDLDELGRCGVAEACIGIDIMPTEERGDIGQVKPSGWHTVKYDCISGKYLYNRCHLIGFQLAGENANEKNLITGTRCLNVDGMLPFENLVANYVERTGNHVMYRVTPDFQGDNLVASGVQMEAQSVEDDEIKFNVYVYNIQPGVIIDYSTGDSWLDNQEAYTPVQQEEMREYTDEERGTEDYMINTSTMKFHNPDCSSIQNTKDENKESFNGPRQWLIENGYEPCGKCKP